MAESRQTLHYLKLMKGFNGECMSISRNLLGGGG
jgi:hypothetical protein